MDEKWLRQGLAMALFYFFFFWEHKKKVSLLGDTLWLFVGDFIVYV